MTFKKSLSTLFLALLFGSTFAQSVAINATGANANASSILDITSTSQGFLTPRMTQAQRNAITGPATGLLIYQTDNTPGFYYYNGSAWTGIGGASPWTTSGSDIYRTTGVVGIGNAAPSGAFELDVHGDVRLSPLSANADWTISNSGIEPTFLPSTDNFGFVGSTGQRVFQGHFTNLTVHTLFTNLSDRSIKENIRPISSALDAVMALQGKQYDLKRDYVLGLGPIGDDKTRQLEKARKDKYGFIAQEVEEVLPSLVHLDEDSQLKSVEYTAVIPVLTEAIKEQQAMIEAQNELILKMEKRIEALEADSK